MNSQENKTTQERQGTVDNHHTNDQEKIIVVQNAPTPLCGILSIVFGAISIFFFALLFVPLSILFGIIGLMKKQKATSIIGIILAIVGVCLSPSFWLILGLRHF